MDELRIEAITEEEYDLLRLVKVKADSEGIQLREFVLDALKRRVDELLPPQPTKPPVVTTGELYEFEKRLNNLNVSLSFRNTQRQRTNCRISSNDSSVAGTNR